MKYQDPASDILNYSFRVKDASDEYFDNLVFSKIDTAYYGFILRYIKAKDLQKGEAFRGTIQRFNLKGDLIGQNTLPATAPSPAPGGRVQRIEPCIKRVEVSCSNRVDISYSIDHGSLTSYNRYADVSVTCTTNFVYGWCDLGGSGGGGWGDVIPFSTRPDLTDYSASNKGGSTAVNKEPTPSPVVVVDEEWSNNTIINNLKNPCLKAAADKALSPSLNKTYNKLIQDVFGKNDKVNLILVEGDLSQYGALGKTDPPSRSGGVISVTITLDPNLLAKTTQELIAATIIHESFHALDLEEKFHPTTEHFAMFTTFLKNLSTTLKQSFPNLSDDEAIDLILKGVLANEANGDFSTEFTNAMISSANSTRERLVKTYLDFKTSTKGTRCN